MKSIVKRGKKTHIYFTEVNSGAINKLIELTI